MIQKDETALLFLFDECGRLFSSVVKEVKHCHLTVLACPVLKRKSTEEMCYVLTGQSEGICVDWYINLISRSSSNYITLNMQTNIS
jgi:hypothetical protein